jgi:hypothetical protein
LSSGKKNKKRKRKRKRKRKGKRVYHHRIKLKKMSK